MSQSYPQTTTKFSHIPNWLTISRIILIPFLVLVFYIPKEYSFKFLNEIALAIFTIACITDWLDGYLARKLNSYSQFGAFLDPLADKLIVSITLILLAKLGRIDIFPVIIIIARELIISGLREWMAILGKKSSVKVSSIGKYKTTFQMLSLAILLSSQYKIYGNITTYDIGVVFLWFSVILTLLSMGVYLQKAYEATNTRQT